MTAADAAENRGFLKNDTSSIGWSECASQAMNATRDSTPITNAPMITGSDQPRVGHFDDAVQQRDQHQDREEGADEVERRRVLVA